MTHQSNSLVQWSANYTLPGPGGVDVAVSVAGEVDFTGTLTFAVTLLALGAAAMVDKF